MVASSEANGQIHPDRPLPKRNLTQMIATNTKMNIARNHRSNLLDEIEELLRSFQGFHPVSKLFWELLGYERRDEAISLAGLTPSLRSTVINARLLASHDKFHIYYLTLTSENLTRPMIRQFYRRFRRKHHFVALLVGNSGQTEWQLVYQPEDLSSAESQGRIATIALGHDEQNLHRQAQAMIKLKTYDEDDNPLDLLEIVAAYDAVFQRVKSQTADKKRSVDGIELLLSEISRYPLLTARQERAILEEIASISALQEFKRGNRIEMHRIPHTNSIDRYQELREKLVVHNLRLCFHISKKYAINQDEIFDLFQESVIGLLRAIELVDVDRNLMFTTYAYNWINQAIRRWIVTNRQFIRMPAHIYELPRTERPKLITVSFNESETGQEYELVDDSSRSPSSNLEMAERTELINESLRTLKERSASIIEQRFGLRDSHEKTLKEVGTDLGLTRERVRQLEGNALEKLRVQLLLRRV